MDTKAFIEASRERELTAGELVELSRWANGAPAVEVVQFITDWTRAARQNSEAFDANFKAVNALVMPRVIEAFMETQKK